MAEHPTCEISISIDIEGSNDLVVTDLWPDGNAPDVITADAIKQLMEDSGTWARVLNEWGVDQYLTVTVHVDAPNPNYTQDTVLIGDPPEKRIRTHAEVWKL